MILESWRKLAAVVAAIVFCESALAQAPWDNLAEPASYVSVEVGDSGWTLLPIISYSNEFIGFFGYLPPEHVVGDNVSLLWLIPDSGDGTWSMYGWLDDDLKVASDFLDNISGRINVLEDTGLDIYPQDDKPLVLPTSMPYGITVGDPSAPLIEATQDPVIAEILVAIGAGGAPRLTQAVNKQPNDCDQIAIIGGDGDVYSELDLQLALSARGVQEMMIVWVSDGILDSLEYTGYSQEDYPDNEGPFGSSICCWPLNWTTYGPWSPWSCTGSPPQANGLCTYTGCTRTRTSFRHT